MPDLIRPPLREVRSRVFDSARWNAYRPRPDDIVVATFPKVGTTWTQRIVSMLVAGSPDPAPIVSPWFDFRIGGPPEMAGDMAEGLTRRRFLKSHLPYDALPVYAGVKFIHVARDGRDAAMSMHNHLVGTKPSAKANFAAAVAGDPKFADDAPPAVAEDPAEFFARWLDDEGGSNGDAYASFFHVENSYWAARREPHMLLVHYNDLKADLDGEIRRIARFLDIEVDPAVLPQIVEAARFETMRAQGDILAPFADQFWDEGARRFIFKGTNGRWQGVVSAEDLARYDRMVTAAFSPALAAWLEHGRRIAGDPERSPN